MNLLAPSVKRVHRKLELCATTIVGALEHGGNSGYGIQDGWRDRAKFRPRNGRSQKASFPCGGHRKYGRSENSQFVRTGGTGGYRKPTLHRRRYCARNRLAYGSPAPSALTDTSIRRRGCSARHGCSKGNSDTLSGSSGDRASLGAGAYCPIGAPGDEAWLIPPGSMSALP